MPKEMHSRLNKAAKKKGLKAKRKKAYVHGTMNKLKKRGARSRRSAY